jgi:hypothetical protein
LLVVYEPFTLQKVLLTAFFFVEVFLVGFSGSRCFGFGESEMVVLELGEKINNLNKNI